MLKEINNGLQSVREWTELTSLFLYFAGAAMVWASLAVYSWRVSESTVPMPQDFVTIHPGQGALDRA